MGLQGTRRVLDLRTPIPMEYKELTQTIIGCAFRVYNTLGFGFLESVYEKALIIELRRAGLNCAFQEPITVYYEGEVVGESMADLLVENMIIVELKSVRSLTTAHEIQLVNYLVATGKPVGLLLNFGETGVEVRRKVRELELKSSARRTERLGPPEIPSPGAESTSANTQLADPSHTTDSSRQSC